MTIGLLGKKCGMTRIYTEDGASIPVTVIEVLPNRVTQIKTMENDGYAAIQVTTGNRKRTRLTKPEAGHFAKAGVEPGFGLWEFRLEEEGEGGLGDIKVGSELKLDRFTVGQYVDVSGITKGKGFAGVIKRHHFNSQDASHGNSLSHRAPGSIGQRQSPGKVFKGKRMAGHMGDVKRTIQSQQIVRIDLDRGLVLIRGGVPGAPDNYVIITPAVKKSA
ncbi:50S ribosomal protein L3 [Aquicella lusitana]|uniref:Large ribosomal subunit protein uL3 n=1 Tax=Aquicella lusitana TaxID=254246 RepID=A0A370GTG1_9COXI|nr:50S ribosomal protein L3 [Aquicella lusitana]RDI46977.1 LSU ribosomal protein L3P [Aquicella lusitana]VVC73867.1 50S ribosomal protein L3 [Aquicella lusitana]